MAAIDSAHSISISRLNPVPFPLPLGTGFFFGGNSFWVLIVALGLAEPAWAGEVNPEFPKGVTRRELDHQTVIPA